MFRVVFTLLIILVSIPCLAHVNDLQVKPESNQEAVCLFEEVIGKNIVLTMLNGDSLRCKLLAVKGDTVSVDCNDGKISRIGIENIRNASIEHYPKGKNGFFNHLLVAIGIVFVVVLLLPSTS